MTFLSNCEAITRLAGNQNGTDLDDATKQIIQKQIEQVEACCERGNAVANVPIDDGTYELVYSSSTNTSAGKLGPFVGEVLQVFPSPDDEEVRALAEQANSKSDKPVNVERTYRNIVNLFGGLLTVSLDAVLTVRDTETIDVYFVQTTFSLNRGAIPVTRQPFDPLRGGYWKCSVNESGWRVLTANTGNVFVLKNKHVQ
ncbi:hypothetical protein NFJ02_08g137580 [Pycnococcus provasolii]